ncbi:MAG: hypothetical protein WA231_07550 [Methylocella sp.]
MINENIEARAMVQDPKLIDRAIEVLAAVIWNIHIKRILYAVDPAPRLNFWRVMYGNQMDRCRRGSGWNLKEA